MIERILCFFTRRHENCTCIVKIILFQNDKKISTFDLNLKVLEIKNSPNMFLKLTAKMFLKFLLQY